MYKHFQLRTDKMNAKRWCKWHTKWQPSVTDGCLICPFTFLSSFNSHLNSCFRECISVYLCRIHNANNKQGSKEIHQFDLVQVLQGIKMPPLPQTQLPWKLKWFLMLFLIAFLPNVCFEISNSSNTKKIQNMQRSIESLISTFLLLFASTEEFYFVITTLSVKHELLFVYILVSQTHFNTFRKCCPKRLLILWIQRIWWRIMTVFLTVWHTVMKNKITVNILMELIITWKRTTCHVHNRNGHSDVNVVWIQRHMTLSDIAH